MLSVLYYVYLAREQWCYIVLMFYVRIVHFTSGCEPFAHISVNFVLDLKVTFLTMVFKDRNVFL